MTCGNFLPQMLSKGKSSSRRRWCMINRLEGMIALSPSEVEAHKELSLLASIPMKEGDLAQERQLEYYWRLMVGEENREAYQLKSQRWSDELGFQSDDPRRDFRGGGVLALICLCFLAERFQEEAQQMATEARSDACWYPFSTAGITICQMIAVHLHLHARPSIGPIRRLPRAHAVALKRFTRQISDSDAIEGFCVLFVAALRKLHEEWKLMCSKDPHITVMQFPEVYLLVGVALERALTSTLDAAGALREVQSRSRQTLIKNFVSRKRSGILSTTLALSRAATG